MVAEAGFIRYEFSNYAQPARMQAQHYLLGKQAYLWVQGAHGYHEHARYGNEQEIQKYIEMVEKENSRAFEEQQSQRRDGRHHHRGLRLTKGLSLPRLYQAVRLFL